ncbi:MAG: 2-aminoethylphosphonate--pyruvate transaminase, partial [Deltaproteobacteria bacterium]|nr:2-aminoethylphosphonate--pyruvate transaminase [Deltaproteobacteria bacterium]
MVKRNILLNPGPATTTDTVKQALVVPDICPREADFGNLTGRVRDGLLQVVNGHPTHTAVMLAGSGTAGVEAVLSSVTGPGHKVLVLDNGAYGRRGEQILKAYAIPHHTHRLAWGDYPDVAALDDLMARNPDWTHFFFVHHETTTGMLNPLDELAALCRKHHLVSIVDAMSSYAGIPINLQTTPVDYLVSSSNKCVQGMAGLSFVISRREALESTSGLPPRNFYLNLYGNHRYWEQTRQFQFTPPVQVVYGLEAALNEFFAEGQAARYARYCRNYDVLMAGLESLGLRTLLPPPQHAKLLTAIVEPSIPGYS